MPKRKRHERKLVRAKRRRIYKRKRSYKIPRGILANTFKQHFRYCANIELNAAASSTIAYHTFSANGLYDPDISGVGHQPLGFDQLVGVTHNHYTVIGSRIKVTFQSTSTGNDGQQYVGIMKTSQSTPPVTSLEDVMEQKRTRGFSVTGLYARSNKVVSNGMNLSKFLGQKVRQDDTCKGSVTSNPAEQAYWQVWACSNDILVNPTKVICLVEIDYIAVLSEPKMLGGS